MVIQRWQTVFLFIATVLMALFTFMPFASATVDSQVANLHPKDFPVYLILNLLIAVLQLKNRVPDTSRESPPLPA